MLASLLLASFGIAIGLNLLRGRKIECGCFGTREPISLTTLGRTTVLLILAILPLVSNGVSVGSLNATLMTPKDESASSFSSIYVIMFALSMLAFLIWYEKHGALSRVFGIPEASEFGLSHGQYAPYIETRDIRGRRVRSKDFGDGEILVLFVRATCDDCDLNEYEIEAVISKSHGRLIVICEDEPGKCLTLASRYPETDAVRVIADHDGSMTRLYGILKQPMAVMVSHRRIKSFGRPGRNPSSGDFDPEPPRERPQWVQVP